MKRLFICFIGCAVLILLSGCATGLVFNKETLPGKPAAEKDVREGSGSSTPRKAPEAHKHVPRRADGEDDKGIVLFNKNDFKLCSEILLEFEAAVSRLKYRSREFQPTPKPDDESDAVLATAQVDFSIEYGKHLDGLITFLWEEDDTEPVELDQGLMRLKHRGFFAGGGKMYLPFSTSETFFVSDAMTHEMGETRETAFLLGYEDDDVGLEFGVAVFNGDSAKAKYDWSGAYLRTRQQNRLEEFAAGLSWEYSREEKESDEKKKIFGFTINPFYISDISDSEVMAEYLPVDPDGVPVYRKRVPGVGMFMMFEAGRFTLLVEGVTATREFDENDIDPDGNPATTRGAFPRACNAEIGFEVADGMTLAFKREWSREFGEFPVSRSGIAFGFEFLEYGSLTFEALYDIYDKDCPLVKPDFFGIDHPAKRGLSATMQLAFQF
jgi:hypothetical protein